ncbi:MAG TPA: hypothetical protein V6D08_11640, partial [Candidatus Obscuribacterales bacterium]
IQGMRARPLTGNDRSGSDSGGHTMDCCDSTDCREKAELPAQGRLEVEESRVIERAVIRLLRGGSKLSYYTILQALREEDPRS